MGVARAEARHTPDTVAWRATRPCFTRSEAHVGCAAAAADAVSCRAVLRKADIASALLTHTSVVDQRVILTSFLHTRSHGPDGPCGRRPG